MSVLFLDESFNFSLFSRVLRVKNNMPILFPQSFWLVDMKKYATKQVLFQIKKQKTSGNQITQHSCIKSKTRGKLATLQEACEKKVSESKVSELVTLFSISSPGSLVFTIVLMIMRVLFVVNTFRKARDPGFRPLSYQLTGNS